MPLLQIDSDDPDRQKQDASAEPDECKDVDGLQITFAVLHVIILSCVMVWGAKNKRPQHFLAITDERPPPCHVIKRPPG